MKGLWLAVLAAIILAPPAAAQTQQGWAQCRTVADSLERLKCFDGLGPAPVAQVGAYEKMTLIDWKTDKASLQGKKVEVEGLAMPFAGGALLSIQAGDVSPVFLDVERVPRDQRRRLLGCSPMCRLSVQGSGGTVQYQQGIIADTLSFR
ncbi:hypothetical protein [Methylobacterium haplocladii]|uniref:Uncharacterized protein n=1 Tax=Methylobacterium haplocladii TaxID=1176176 RepID=A0A512ISE6_9HYPH|nr:hypothetical protein [Methylobacterium haplocladii]GEP00635.1 hypothetical protein MHA02_30220 [Methylobacterium haplocladii]GJD85550.1 hypothetical protein HPGCJGGD_3439 [Methylobacterium haplocladii]GLS57783.1 hypothetical protein GCM10007887_04390 [Methylobacterium haplocladii]